ncbi:hypothetical protein [Enterobacter roggenkampii]|uniref:hypothetical protein n=1 Tax=Enterobacter roggenkampii TaxID=1812935 RepID=UPI002FF8F7EC
MMTLPPLCCRKARPADIDKIEVTFPDLTLNPFKSERFPEEINTILRALLVSSLEIPERELQIYTGENPDESIGFTLLEQNDNYCTLLLAGVWPAYRGKGIIRSIMGNLLT